MRRVRDSARRIRALIRELVQARAAQIAAGTAPADLATTKIMTTPDPQTGATFNDREMIDEVATFFLAGTKPAFGAGLGAIPAGWKTLTGRNGWRTRPNRTYARLPGGETKPDAARAVFPRGAAPYPRRPTVRECRQPETLRPQAPLRHATGAVALAPAPPSAVMGQS